MEFKCQHLEKFFDKGTKHRKIPSDIESPLLRKLDMLNAAKEEKDLLAPPNNRFKHLQGKLLGYCSIRVNRQYRLIFKLDNGEVTEVYLDPHTYK